MITKSAQDPVLWRDPKLVQRLSNLGYDVMLVPKAA